MPNKDIPLWGWFMGQLLLKLDKDSRQNPEKTISSFMTQFIEEHELQVLEPFQPMNPGTVMMLMYALLVVPREIWEAQSASFPFTTRSSFNVTQGADISSETAEFLRLLRNSVSHANCSLDTSSQSVTFWNETRTGTRNFETSIGIVSLGEFLTEIGKYYNNVVRKADQVNG